MYISNRYRVAGHLFQLVMNTESALHERMAESYSPFLADGTSDDCVFCLTVTDSLGDEGLTLIYSNIDNVELGFIAMNIYKDEKSQFYFEFINPGSNQINARLSISNNYKEAQIALDGTEIQQWSAFNIGVNFCYLLATAKLSTVLCHASCVMYLDKAWLFLGKSGTGKSTHSRMWEKALDNVILINDDHPIIRIGDKGEVFAYGSPWSGKTNCYKNIKVPLGGVIRIVRAQYNKVQRLSMIESYASLMTSCSGMTWEKQLADGRDKTIQGIISSVPCWVMECLPNEDAAKICSQTVTKV